MIKQSSRISTKIVEKAKRYKTSNERKCSYSIKSPAASANHFFHTTEIVQTVCFAPSKQYVILTNLRLILTDGTAQKHPMNVKINLAGSSFVAKSLRNFEIVFFKTVYAFLNVSSFFIFSGNFF